MIDITHKKKSLRIATATAVVHCSKESIAAVKNKTVPKGDVLEMAKTAGLFAVKRTADMIPDCHPLPVEYTGITYQIKEDEIHIYITVKAIYRTGLEVEAMHGASVVALTMYDMLKPIDKSIEIKSIKLIEKSGGKSDLKRSLPKNLTAAIVSVSDLIVDGKKEDKGAAIVREKLRLLSVEIKDYQMTRSDKTPVQNLIKDWVLQETNIIFVLGGSGLSATDKTPDIINEILDRKLPAIANQQMNYGFERTYKSMISIPIAGTIGRTIIIGLPGSEKGASELFDAVMPEALYLFKSINYNT